MANSDARLDAEVKHQIGLLRVSEGVARRVVAVLNRADADIVRKIVEIDPSDVERARYRQERLEKLLEAVRTINTDIYRQLRRALASELEPVAEVEVEFQERNLRQGTNARLSLPTPEEAYAAAVARPFQGRLLREMYAGIEEAAKVRLRDAIRMGFVQGESVDQVVRRIRGTRANGYRDGVLEIGRKDAYRVARTAVAHTAAVARDAVFQANADILQGTIWISVIDHRTSPPCRARSQKAYTVDHKPIGHNLPYGAGPGRFHFGCRSTEVAWLEGEDKPEGLSYNDWLKRQSAEVQRDILGPTRYKLWKEGGVTLDRFVERSGAALTIDQLRQRDAEAFEKAGLDA